MHNNIIIIIANTQQTQDVKSTLIQRLVSAVDPIYIWGYKNDVTILSEHASFGIFWNGCMARRVAFKIQKEQLDTWLASNLG